MDRSRSAWLTRGLRVAGALGLALVLSGCIVVPGPRYGSYHPWHPYHYGYY